MKTIRIKGYARVGSHRRPFMKDIARCPRCYREIEDNSGLMEIYHSRVDAERGSSPDMVEECTITIKYKEFI